MVWLWGPGGLRLAISQECIYLHTLQVAAWRSGCLRVQLPISLNLGAD